MTMPGDLGPADLGPADLEYADFAVSSDEEVDNIQYHGSVEFIIGPSRIPIGARIDLRECLDIGPLLTLALIAAKFGKTVLLDYQGVAIILGGSSEPSVELF